MGRGGRQARPPWGRQVGPGARGYPSFRGVASSATCKVRFGAYAATTLLLGILVISSIPIALARACSSGPAQFIQTMAVVLMIGGPLVLIAAITFAGSPRGTRCLRR